MEIYKETLQDHEQRLRKLEDGSIRISERMESVCEKIESLTTWIKWLIITLCSVFLGFFVWYVQSLPR